MTECYDAGLNLLIEEMEIDLENQRKNLKRQYLMCKDIRRIHPPVAVCVELEFYINSKLHLINHNTAFLNGLIKLQKIIFQKGSES